MNGTTDQTRHQDRVWSVAEHLDDVLSKIHPLEPIELQLLDAQGCVLVEDITVPLALPPFDNSSMDGYAVRVADVAGATEEFPAALTVIGDVAAGSMVDENWLLDLERRQFMALVRNVKTQERIQHTLKTGKPLRN